METKEGMRATVVCVVLGLLAAALGAMFWAASRIGEGSPNQDLASGLGLILLTVSLPIFAISLLVELFSIGTCVRQSVRSSVDILSLLRSQIPSPQVSAHPRESSVGPIYLTRAA